MLMSQSKVHPLSPVPLGEKRLFLLHYSLHSSCFEAITNSLDRERLVGDIPEDFGYIHSSINLPKADETLCMTNVGRGKFGRTSTKRLREVRAMFRTKPRDSANAMTSRSCNMGSCITSIKQRKDMILTSRRQSAHCGNWALSVAESFIFILQHNMIM